MYAVRQLRLAAGTGPGWNSRHLLSLTQGREPTDPPPVTRHAERRKLREARSLRAVLGQLFAKLGNPETVRYSYEFVVRKSAYRYTFCVWPTVKKSDRPRVKNV
jgi:hypothetical protein